MLRLLANDQQRLCANDFWRLLANGSFVDWQTEVPSILFALANGSTVESILFGKRIPLSLLLSYNGPSFLLRITRPAVSFPSLP